jgi:enamine deaminase RidA (YjgF/YER057c/UK114 family)
MDSNPRSPERNYAFRDRRVRPLRQFRSRSAAPSQLINFFGCRVFTVDVDKLQAAMRDPSTKRPENSEHPPTSTMIGVTRLSHPDFLIEIDLVAITEA